MKWAHKNENGLQCTEFLMEEFSPILHGEVRGAEVNGAAVE